VAFVRTNLRLPAAILAAAVIIGATLALTLRDGDEGPAEPERQGSAGAANGATGKTTGPNGTGARAYPLPIDGPLLGVNLTAYSADGYSRPDVEEDMATLAGLGTTAVTLVPTWYMRGPDADRIGPDDGKSPTDESLARAIDWARDNGLRVVIKPHVDVLDESYRGEIRPRDREAWFRSYRGFIDHYAELASSGGADMLVVGTELKSMSSETDRWRRVIEGARARFGGPLTYAANWDEAESIQFWDALDAIGVDAYYPLTDEGERPTPKRLLTAWREIAAGLRALSERWGRPVILTEVGYPSQAGATTTPFEVTDGPADQRLQALAYRTVFRALRDAGWLQGISWWSWRADPSPEEKPDVDYSPEGKQAQGELARGQTLYAGSGS